MTMRALTLIDTRPDYAGVVLDDRPQPEPAAGEAIVKVRAAAVTFVDLLMSRGGYQFRPSLPYGLGSDFAGEVVTGGERFSAGAPIIGMHRGGAFAEYIAVPERDLMPKPDCWSFETAAGFGQAYLTAYVALVRHAHLRRGEWLLVHGASGGVGLAAVDLGMRMGAKVIAASASEEKLAAIERLHAPTALLNVRGGFREAVKALTGGGADVVYDPVGGAVFEESLRCTAYHGRVLIVGFAGGTIPSVPMNYPLIKGLQIIGVRAGEYGRRFPDHAREDRAALATIAAEGAARPHAHAAFPLSEWRRAFAMVEGRQVVGRVILLP